MDIGITLSRCAIVCCRVSGNPAGQRGCCLTNGLERTPGVHLRKLETSAMIG